MNNLKPHHHYLKSKSASEIIDNFRKFFTIFICSYAAIYVIVAVILFFMRHSLDMEIAITSFLILMLIVGTAILPKIHEVAKLLNEKEIMDIAPILLILLQFFLNLTLTTAIIPMFLLAKCNELEKRRQAKKKNL